MDGSGKHFDEVAIGATFASTLTITETHLVLGAGLIGDFNPHHANEVYAKRSRFGTRVLHGMLTSAVMGAAVGMYFHGTAIAYLEHNARFLAPVRPGDTLTTTWTVVELLAKPKHGGGIVVLKAAAVNQHGVTVAEADGRSWCASAPEAPRLRRARVESGGDGRTGLDVTAVRALETGERARDEWTDADRAWASRAAAEVVGEHASPEQFVGRRATLALERIGERDVRFVRATRALEWRPWVGHAVIGGAFVLGVAVDRIGGAQTINLLAPPVFLLLVWNLAVYAMLALAPFVHRGPGETLGVLRAALARFASGTARAPRTRDAARSGRYAATATDWARLSARSMRRAPREILHFAAARRGRRRRRDVRAALPSSTARHGKARSSTRARCARCLRPRSRRARGLPGSACPTLRGLRRSVRRRQKTQRPGCT